MSNQKIKADEGKPKLSLVPWQIVYDIARVREYGNQKYGDSESWREVEPERYIDALLRHTLAFASDPFGRDGESGLPHLWHVATNVAFLCAMFKSKYRRKKGRLDGKRAQHFCRTGKTCGRARL